MKKSIENLSVSVQMSRISLLLATTLNAIPYYHIYKNILQIFYNGRHLLLQETTRPTIEMIEEPIQIIGDKSDKKSKTEIYSSIPPYANGLVETLTTEASAQVKVFSEEHDPVQIKKEKVKTRAWTPKFHSAKTFDKTPKNKKIIMDTTEMLFPITEREERLAEVKTMRGYNQINEREMQSALQTLTKLLPKGHIAGIDGSEWQLTWSWLNKNFSLKFEAPHGVDANQFRGRKLSKAINVLEAGYLWGWEKRKRDSYLSESNCHSNLKRLMYIFGERPKL